MQLAVHRIVKLVTMLLNCVLFLTGLVTVFGADPPPATFLLVNQKDATQRTQLVDDFSGIDTNLETIVITHGYQTNVTAVWIYNMSTAFFKRGNCNIIVVDWDAIANEFYTTVLPKTVVVGEYLGNFLLRLAKSIALQAQKIHLVGHSLGAHVSGFAGQTTKAQNFLIGRITALDAANPGYPTWGFDNDDHRVSTDDTAKLVAIHTDGGLRGIFNAYAHIDFYANTGTSIQPACQTLTEILTLDFSSCSHAMAPAYFTESINSNNFIGKRCSNEYSLLNKCDSSERAIFGPSTTDSGIYFFKTGKASPYAMGEAGL